MSRASARMGTCAACLPVSQNRSCSSTYSKCSGHAAKWSIRGLKALTLNRRRLQPATPTDSLTSSQDDQKREAALGQSDWNPRAFAALRTAARPLAPRARRVRWLDAHRYRRCGPLARPGRRVQAAWRVGPPAAPPTHPPREAEALSQSRARDRRRRKKRGFAPNAATRRAAASSQRL